MHIWGPAQHVLSRLPPMPPRPSLRQGSSSIGASLISGVPLISHRYMLKSYK